VVCSTRRGITVALCAIVLIIAVDSVSRAEAALLPCQALSSNSSSGNVSLAVRACSWQTRPTPTGTVSVQGQHGGHLPTLVLQNSSALLAGSQPGAAGAHLWPHLCLWQGASSSRKAFQVELMSACILQACFGISQQQQSAGDNCFPATAQCQHGCACSGVQLPRVLCKPRIAADHGCQGMCLSLLISQSKLALHCCTAVRVLLQATHSCYSG
jgi:hypothetical protein